MKTRQTRMEGRSGSAHEGAQSVPDLDTSVRDTQQSSDMVERVALALDPEAFAYEQLVPRRSYWQRRRKAARNSATAALEASHHAELYEALRDAANALQNLATRVTDHGSSPELRAKQEAIQEQANAAFDALAKIGGDA